MVPKGLFLRWSGGGAEGEGDGGNLPALIQWPRSAGTAVSSPAQGAACDLETRLQEDGLKAEREATGDKGLY